jgi:hypothetical protein
MELANPLAPLAYRTCAKEPAGCGTMVATRLKSTGSKTGRAASDSDRLAGRASGRAPSRWFRSSNQTEHVEADQGGRRTAQEHQRKIKVPGLGGLFG